MRPTVPVLAACFSLALTGVALVRAENQSEKLLDQATFAESQDPTQVREEKAIEKKDGMDAPQTPDAGQDATKTRALDAATGAAGAAVVPHK